MPEASRGKKKTWKVILSAFQPILFPFLPKNAPGFPNADGWHITWELPVIL